MLGFLHRLDLFCVSVAMAIVNLFFPPVLFFVVFRCLNVWIPASSGFVLCVGGQSHRKSFLSTGSVFCLVQVLTGFLNVWISASSGFVLRVGSHSLHKSFLSPRFCVVFRCSPASYMFRFLRLVHLCCASVAIAIANIFLPLVLFFVLFRCSQVS